MPWASSPTASPRCCSRRCDASFFAGRAPLQCASFMSAPGVARSQPVTRPELRECPGCGQFQIVPALGPDMRSNCVRCGTALRLTRADPLNRHLALTFAAMVLFAVLWLAMLMKVSTAGIVHETTLESGSDRAGQSRPVAACAGGRLHHRDRTRHQVRRHGLCPGRPQDAPAAAQPARRIPGGAPHGHLGHARSAAAGRVRGLHQARRPGHHRARPRGLCAGPAHHRHRVGRSRVRPPCRVGGDRAARPDARADARNGAARLSARRGRAARAAAWYACRPRATANARAAALPCTSASPAASCAPGPS